MTCGPEPKPIRTGATLHTVCVTEGPLSTYKLFARTYGGKTDEDMNKRNEHTVTKLKMVSLYDFMLLDYISLQPMDRPSSHSKTRMTPLKLYPAYTE